MKFVSLPQLLGCPLFGSNSGLFTVPGFIVSPVGIKGEKKDEEGRKKRYKGKERRKERKKVLKEKINNKKILLKKEKPPAGFKLAKLVFLVFLAAAG